jgi:hypothetical protein
MGILTKVKKVHQDFAVFCGFYFKKTRIDLGFHNASCFWHLKIYGWNFINHSRNLNLKIRLSLVKTLSHFSEYFSSLDLPKILLKNIFTLLG